MVSLLDCTLRDGGYYNDWDFPKDLVEEYLGVMAEASIDFVELGFRFVKPDGFIGPYGFTTDNWIRTLQVPEDLALGVMCNAKDLLSGGDSENTVRRLFSPAAESPVELVRIAAHFKEVEDCEVAVRTLHELGYRVGLNLMQSGIRTEEEISEKARVVARWPLEVLYFADSLGDMRPDDVRRTVQALHRGWHGDLGFHAHDNMGMALINNLTAHEAGVQWLDGTVMGMGRGAGNVRLEYLLLELDRLGVRSSHIDRLLEFVVERFAPLQRQYQWGPNLFYHLSAMYSVHPTYVQEMLADERYSHDQVVSALQRLGYAGATGYSPDRLLEAVGDELPYSEGRWDATGWLEDRDVLVLGPGEQGRIHNERVVQFVEERQPVVLCLNSNPWFPPRLIDAWVACNSQRLILDRDYYHDKEGVLVAPESMIPTSVLTPDTRLSVYDYGIECDKHRFEPGPKGATLPAPLAALYAIALANAGGARKIWLIGLDGFTKDDPRHQELEDALAVCQNTAGTAPITALTPTELNVPRKSVYEPDV